MPTAINHKSPQSGGVVRSSVRLFERLTGCRDVPLFQELVKENEGLRQLAKELRSSGEKLQRQQEEELRKLYERKFADQKAKCKQEVMKVVDSQKSQLKRSYDDRLHTVVKVKEKEIQTLQKKLTQSQEQLLSRSRDSLKFSPKIDFKPEVMELRFRIKALEEQISLCTEREKLKDEEIKKLGEIHQKDISRVTRDYKKHIGSLLEELRTKDKQVVKLEGNLKSAESRIPVLNANDSSTSRTPDMSPGRGLGFATRFQTNVVPKDELEKERQKWEIRVCELETQIEKLRNDLANSEMEKKPLVAQINSLESKKLAMTESQEILEEFVKSLQTEKELLIVKVSELQEENLKLASGSISKSDVLQMQISGTSTTVQQMKELLSQSLDEMERLKQQNTELGKTVAALKQAALEKDRKIDLLQNKLKRIKRHKNSDAFGDDDNHSYTTEMSQSATSLTSLDTIVEDWEEFAKEEIEENYRHLTREHLELKRAFALLSRNQTRDPQRLIHREKELERQLKQAANRIEELEKHLKGNSIPIPDGNWTSEKVRYINMIKNLQHRLVELEEFQEKLYQDLQDSREQNELLEFQILEIEHSDTSESHDKQSCSAMQIRKKCDRSVSTSDDEAFFSNEEIVDYEEQFRPLTPEEIKVRFALLKHKKGLNSEEKFIVTQVRDLLENLQAQHGNCKNQLMEYELQLRQSDAHLRQIEQKFQAELDKLKSEKSDTEKSQFEKEMSEAIEKLKLSEMKVEKLKQALEESGKEVAKLSYMLGITEDSDKKNKVTIAELKRQLDSLTQARNAELNILEEKLKLHSIDLEKAQKHIESLNAELAQSQTSNTSMSEKLSAMQKQLEIAHDSKVNKEQFASLKSELKSALASKLELESQLQAGNSTDTQIKELRVNLEEKLQTIANLDRKYQDMRQKFKESLKIIKEYELTDAKYQQKLTQLIERNKQIQSEFSEVELKLKNCGCEIAAKNEEINQLSAQLSNQPISNDFTTEIEELKRLNEEIRETLGQKDGKIQQLQAYNDQIEAQFQVQLSTVNFLKEQLIMSQTKLKQSEVSLATLKTEAEDLRSQYTQACTKLEKQNSSQKDFNSEISTEIAELCKNLELYRVEVESKTKTIEELQGHLTKAHLALGLKVSECCENETVLPKPKSDYITSVEENLKEFQLEIDSIIQTFVTADTNEYQERLALLTDSCASLQTAVIEKISELDRRMAQFQFSLAKIQKQEIAPESSLQGTKNDLNTRLDKAQLESTVLQSINGRLSRISTVVDKLKFGETHKKEELPPDEPSLRDELRLNFSTDNHPERKTERQKSDVILHELLAHLKATITSNKCSSESDEAWKVLEAIERKIVDLSSEGYRSSSPLEHSGTESEMFDKSPLLPRTDPIFCSTPDSARPQPHLQSFSELEHSSHEEDSLSDSTVSVIRRERNKKANRKLLKRRVTLHTTGNSVNLEPPTNLSVVGQLDDKTLIISWCPPITSSIDGGYKIYLEDQLCHTIMDVDCRSAVIRLIQPQKHSDRTDVKIVLIRFDGDGKESPATVLHYSRIDATFETDKIELTTGPKLNLGPVTIEEDSSEV